MSSSRKHRIFLPDYDYRQDIENRLIMAELTSFEVEVLKEITNGPLQVPIGLLEETLGATSAQLLPLLTKFSKNQLLTLRSDGSLILDKEQRRYYERELCKFDENFKPGLPFLESLLNKVPRPALLNWYSIPRSTDHIFTGLVEKYLSTPLLYERYIREMVFDNPITKQIIYDIFSEEVGDFQVKPTHLMEKYSLSREELEEHILLLEFSFACCITYVKDGDIWREMVTPFQEWREYLRFKRDVTPMAIMDRDRISYSSLDHEDNLVIPFSHRLLVDIGKSLKGVIDVGWIYFEDFMQGFHAPIGNTETKLLKKGRHWSYALPDYSPQEKAVVEAAIFQRLFSAGIVITGMHNGRPCFSVTPFGRSYLED